MDKIRDCEHAAFVLSREECREEVTECRPGGRETTGLHAAEGVESQQRCLPSECHG